MPTPYYALQPSFAGGAISPEVASRVDIEKFQSALLTAENVIIKPYGGVRNAPARYTWDNVNTPTRNVS